MNVAERKQFDGLLETILHDLPPQLHDLLEEVPLIVEDHPSPALIDELDLTFRDDLCGLHDGIPLTHRSVNDSGHLPEQIMLFREGIWSTAQQLAGRFPHNLHEQIQITLLHEIGHHFGLDEDDLAKLGYD